jgi:hypothetical protein
MEKYNNQKRDFSIRAIKLKFYPLVYASWGRVYGVQPYTLPGPELMPARFVFPPPDFVMLALAAPPAAFVMLAPPAAFVMLAPPAAFVMLALADPPELD